MELLVTITLLSILLAVALPSFSTWVRNGKTRTVAESLANGLRLAQAEAVRRNRQVVFSLTNDAPAAAATATPNGRNWVIRTVAVPGEDPSLIEGGSLGSSGDGVTVTGAGSLCFNSLGRQTANTTPGATGRSSGGTSVPAGSCTPPNAGTPTAFNVAFASPQSGDRTLRVTVSLGGQVRLCDPARSLASSPDGCA